MEKRMSIEGMMCVRCEARVKKSLEEIEGVTEALVSHEKNEAVVFCSDNVTDEMLKNAVENKGYKVTGITE